MFMSLYTSPIYFICKHREAVFGTFHFPLSDVSFRSEDICLILFDGCVVFHCEARIGSLQIQMVLQWASLYMWFQASEPVYLSETTVLSYLRAIQTLFFQFPPDSPGMAHIGFLLFLSTP